ncbi:MAG TPA: hypothetical protein PLW65_22705, partial [Pseudomonadota bacterium]|nr:hypothetical protein [Pseudomonadota bacterium]
MQKASPVAPGAASEDTSGAASGIASGIGPEPLSPVWSAVARVRRRLRLQAATRLAVRGLLVAAGAVFLALVLLKLRLIAGRTVWSVGLGGGGLVVGLAL